MMQQARLIVFGRINDLVLFMATDRSAGEHKTPNLSCAWGFQIGTSLVGYLTTT